MYAIYDIETQRSVFKTSKVQDKKKYEYVDSWKDLQKMGIAVLCAYVVYDDKLLDKKVFYGDIDNFVDSVSNFFVGKIPVGFNNHRFDDKILDANNIYYDRNESVDLKEMIMIACNVNSNGGGRNAHRGFSLSNLVKINIDAELDKTLHGSEAPILWQDGHKHIVADYCLRDVEITYRLFDSILKTKTVVNPVTKEKVRINI